MQEHQHFGIYALILDKRNTHILLIKKARGPYTGKLDLPGGTPEAEETSTETLVREVLEETGAHVSSSRELGLFTVKFQYLIEEKPHQLTHKGYIFEANIGDDISSNIASPDSSGCIWVKIKNIIDMEVTPPVIEALKMHSNRNKKSH